MLRITLPYLAIKDNVAFLQTKQWMINNQIWKAAFYIHVFTSVFLLFAGYTQFSKEVLKDYKTIHRIAGYFYVVIILVLSGPSGLIMGIYANGGLLSQSAFVLLSVLWIFFTAMAFIKALQKDFSSHREFMIRSYALTLSALTLRLWKLLLVYAFRPNPMDAYMIVAWLGWIPNLLIAEWIIKRKFSSKRN